MLKYKSAEVVVEDPYFKISFGCSNSDFYEVKNVIYTITNDLEEKEWDGLIEEKCDFEGDLENIIIYNCDSSKRFINKILDYYSIDEDIKDMDLHLSIF